mgnify:FL=1|jgi:hypothetical protein|tara:strand:- start:90 stop:245 length:156 start_codon:yes stop_codon:yes gene_type:complete
MKAEDFIARLQAIMDKHDGSMEVVVYDQSVKYIEPVATVMPIGGTDKIVIM